MEENNKESTFFGDILNPTETLGTGYKANLDMRIKGSRGWIAFIGIFLIVYAGLELLFFLLALLTRGVSEYSHEFPLGLVFVVELVLFGLIIFFGVLLFQSSRHAKRYLETEDEAGLIRYHTRMFIFFKTAGIVIIVGLSLGLIFTFVLALV